MKRLLTSLAVVSALACVAAPAVVMACPGSPKPEKPDNDEPQQPKPDKPKPKPKPPVT